MNDQRSRADLRVVIVAEHPMLAEVIRRGLKHVPSLQVIGFVDSRRSCAEAVASATPDIVLIDEPKAASDVLPCIRELRAALPEAMLILLSARIGSAALAEGAAAGLDAAVAKTGHPDSIGLLVREIAAGNVFHAFRPSPSPVQPNENAADGLTSRELEILGLVASGASNSRIAGELWVTEQTVKFHLSNLYRKLGVANRTQAGHYAHVHGLVAAPAASAMAPRQQLAVAA
jgi:DNA-binding NarL/FixJ family response regulator